MTEKHIKQLCAELPFSKTDIMTDEVFDDTLVGMNTLWKKYGFAKIFGVLSEVWSYEKAVSFFKRYSLNEKERREPLTIACYSRKAYDGGVERVNAELLKLWVGMGYKVVFFSVEGENEWDYPYPKSVKRIVVPGDYGVSRLEMLEKVCIEEDVGLFVNNDWINRGFIWECMLMKKLKIPYVLYCHGHFSWNYDTGKAALFQSEAFKLCDLVLALSETNARFYQLSGCDSYLVENPVPESLKKNVIRTSNRSFHVLWIGRISEEKYPMDALKIFRLVHGKCHEAVLDIVGTGNTAIIEEMKNYINNNGLKDSVFFHGIQRVSEVESFYRSATCVLFTSKMEGYPMIVLESKAYGLPLVMYEMPFLSLTSDKLGVMTAPIGNITIMANNLCSILKDEELSNRLGEEALRSFRNLCEYDLKKTWEQIISISCEGSVPVEDPCYYAADKLSDAERSILPILFEKLIRGYDNTFYGSRDYRVGHALLKLPRSLIGLINQ